MQQYFSVGKQQRAYYSTCAAVTGPLFLFVHCPSAEMLSVECSDTDWLVLLLVRNFASARANQAAGSEIQNVGRVSLLGWVAGAASAAGGDWGRGRNRMLPRMVANQL